MVYRLVFEAYWPLVLRGPSLFEATVYGPGAAARSLDYPQPSTLAGALASLAYESRMCSPSPPSPGSPFGDQEECLRRLLGSSFHLYTGFIEYGGGMLVYTPQGYVEPATLQQAIQCAARKLGEGVGEFLRELNKALKASRAARLPRRRRVGIAVNPSTRTVVEGYLYTLEETYPPQGGRLGIVVLAEASGSALLAGIASSPSGRMIRVVKLGAENRPALLRAEQAAKSIPGLLLHGSSNCGKWLLYLASPALLASPPGKLLLSPGTARSIAEGLLQPLGLQNAKLVEPYLATASPIEVYMPGWSMAAGNYREPMLVVPPATMLFVEADYGTVEQIVRRGLGMYTHLGWGTILAYCIT